MGFLFRSAPGVVLLSVALCAGAQNLPSVDIETANMQIEQFEQENRSLESSGLLLGSSVERLRSDIELWTEWVSGIDKVTVLLERQADQLFDVLAEIGSRSIVERAQSTLERSFRIAALLKSKLEELAARIADAEAMIARHTATISLYRKRIEQNIANISLLEAAIAKSQNSESLIESYLDDFDDILDTAIRLLDESAR